MKAIKRYRRLCDRQYRLVQQAEELAFLVRTSYARREEAARLLAKIEERRTRLSRSPVWAPAREAALAEQEAAMAAEVVADGVSIRYSIF